MAGIRPCFSVAGNRQRTVERGAGRQMRMQDSFSDDFVSAVDVFKKALAVKKRRSMKGKGESRARVARPKILVYICVYVYTYVHKYTYIYI